MAVAEPSEGMPTSTFFDEPWIVVGHTRSGHVKLRRFHGEDDVEMEVENCHVLVEHPANNYYVEVIRSQISGAGLADTGDPSSI